jgi:hypothetical protein
MHAPSDAERELLRAVREECACLKALERPTRGLLGLIGAWRGRSHLPSKVWFGLDGGGGVEDKTPNATKAVSEIWILDE